MAERDEHAGNTGKTGVDIEYLCEICEQKELCTVYNGSSCLLIKEHEENEINLYNPS